MEDAGFEDNFFDVITMTDVFEHITNPDKILRESRRILKPDGVLFIKVPNGLFNIFKFHLARITGRLSNYDIFDSYEHVIHYSGSTLKKCLKRMVLRLLKCILEALFSYRYGINLWGSITSINVLGLWITKGKARVIFCIICLR